METEIASGIVDVPGQPAQPTLADAGPNQNACQRDHHAGYYQEFAYLAHVLLWSLNDGAGSACLSQRGRAATKRDLTTDGHG
jgi:hypothetical protein